MKRASLLLIVGLAGHAQAEGLDALMNSLGTLAPAGLSSPFAPSPFAPNPFAAGAFGGNPLLPSPYGYGVPLGMASPFGLGSPMGGLGAAAPLGLGMLNPLGGGLMGSAMYPTVQVAPNMMSYQHYNQLTNPYAGGPFAGNPYIQRSLPNPFAAPAFSPSIPTLPSMPFAIPQQQGALAGLVPLPQQPLGYGPLVGYGQPAASPQAALPWLAVPLAPQAPPASVPQNPFPFLSSVPQQPAKAPEPATAAFPAGWFPFLPVAPVKEPVEPAAAPEQAAPGLLPFLPIDPPQDAAQPAQPGAATDSSAASAPLAWPMDPAVFMQMLMKPVEMPK